MALALTNSPDIGSLHVDNAWAYFTGYLLVFPLVPHLDRQPGPTLPTGSKSPATSDDSLYAGVFCVLAQLLSVRQYAPSIWSLELVELRYDAHPTRADFYCLYVATIPARKNRGADR